MDDRLQALIAAEDVPFWQTLGIEVVDASEGRATLRLATRLPLETRRPGTMHGGVLASLIDAAGSAALLTLRDDDDETWAGFSSTDLTVSYLAAARSDVRAEARVLRAGGAVVYTAVDVTDAEDMLVAVGRVTYFIQRRRER